MRPEVFPDSYPTSREFLKVLRSRGFSGRIADFSLCAVLLTALVGKYLKLRDILGLSEPFFAKAQLHDCWRIIPFVNMPCYIQHIHQWGIPIVRENRTFAPPGLTPDALIRLDAQENLIEGSARSAGLMTALPLAAKILWAAGVGALADPEKRKEFASAMMEAATRMAKRGGASRSNTEAELREPPMSK